MANKNKEKSVAEILSAKGDELGSSLASAAKTLFGTAGTRRQVADEKTAKEIAEIKRRK